MASGKKNDRITLRQKKRGGVSVSDKGSEIDEF